MALFSPRSLRVVAKKALRGVAKPCRGDTPAAFRALRRAFLIRNASRKRVANTPRHWFHLIQPSPLPETMLGAAWQPYLHAKLGGWGGSGLAMYEPQAIAEYERHFAKPETIHAMCEDYRASASIDLEHDRASRAAGHKLACDTLVLWGERGVVQQLFNPLALWQAQCASEVTGHAMPAGHFIPEQLPQETAQALATFFR